MDDGWRAQTARESMKTWVYFLLCENDALYTGTAIDPLSRFRAHCAGRGARFTKMRKPIRLLGAFVFETRGEALSNEYRFKRLPALEKRRLAALAAEDPAWLAYLAQHENG
jgi:putative endonuclease